MREISLYGVHAGPFPTQREFRIRVVDHVPRHAAISLRMHRDLLLMSLTRPVSFSAFAWAITTPAAPASDSAKERKVLLCI